MRLFLSKLPPELLNFNFQIEMPLHAFTNVKSLLRPARRKQLEAAGIIIQHVRRRRRVQAVRPLYILIGSNRYYELIMSHEKQGGRFLLMRGRRTDKDLRTQLFEERTDTQVISNDTAKAVEKILSEAKANWTALEEQLNRLCITKKKKIEKPKRQYVLPAKLKLD